MNDLRPTNSAQTAYKAIFTLFWPLALSWLFMALEQPSLNRVLNGLPDPELTKASLFLLMGLSLFFESPVIDLLSTGTVFGKEGASVKRVQQFTLAMMGLTVLTHGTVAFTPLFDFVTVNILHQTPRIVEATRQPFQIMVFWASFVGLRRIHQGLMIRTGLTKAIGFGTVIRLVALIGVAAGFSRGLQISPLHSVAWALLISVIVESLYVLVVSRQAVRQLRLMPESESTPTLGKIARFHFPQTATTLVVMLAMPTISFAIARTQQPELFQSAFSMGFALQWMFRSPTYALPELVIANHDDPNRGPQLDRFCWIVGISLSTALLLVALSPVGGLMLDWILNSSANEARLALPALGICAALPLINARMAWYRGQLTLRHITLVRLWAILAGFLAMAGSLMFMLEIKVAGNVLPALGLIAGQLSELFVLGIAYRLVKKRECPSPIAEQCHN